MPGEEVVEDDEGAKVLLQARGEEARQPDEGACLDVAGHEVLHPPHVIGEGVPTLVERKVHDDPPGLRCIPEPVLRQLLGVAHVAEDEVDGAGGTAPGDFVRECAVGRVALRLHASGFEHELLQQLATPAGVVLPLRILDDRLVVDVGEVHRVDGGAVAAAHFDVTHARGPAADLPCDDARFPAAQRGGDRAVVQGGEPLRGERGQGRHTRGDGAQQKRVGEALVGAVGAQAHLIAGGEVVLGETAVCQQQRLQLLPEDLIGAAEQGGATGVEHGAIVAGDDVLVGVADGDDLVDGHGVSPLHEHLLHDLQRGAVALHHAGEGAQGGDERG